MRLAKERVRGRGWPPWLAFVAAIALAALVACACPGCAGGTGARHAPGAKDTASQAPAGNPPVPLSPVTARGAALYDAITGTVLYAQDAGLRLEPASLVKMMTLYLAYADLARGAVSLDERVPVSEKAWRTGGSRMFIEAGAEVPFGDLLRGAAVASGNDAAVAAAERLGGTEEAFVARMNAMAGELRLADTRFSNSHGLPAAGQFMSARDAALLGIRLINDFPESLTVISQKQFTWAGITQLNRNALLFSDARVDGIKTGHAAEAGYSVVASAKSGEMRLVAAVMGAPTEDGRFSAARQLLNYGFAQFSTAVKVERGQSLGSTRVYKGRQVSLRVLAGRSLAVTSPRGAAADLRVDLVLTGLVVAPVRQGQKVGEVVLYRDDEEVGRADALAGEAVARGPLWRVVWDSIILALRGVIRRGA